jgi:hypothetical protein
MTRGVPFTKAKLRRAIDVAREKGFRVLARPGWDAGFREGQ